MSDFRYAMTLAIGTYRIQRHLKPRVLALADAVADFFAQVKF